MQKNENRPGFKKTKLGWIPEEWEMEKLENIASVERGKFSARPRNDPKYYGGTIPFLQTGDVATATGIVSSYSQTLNEEGLKVSRLFPSGTLLITIAANIGDVAEVGMNFACPDSLVAVQPKQHTDKDWLKHFLQTKKRYFEGQATQNAQANINLQTIRPLKLPRPPLPEQKAIAGVLSEWDRAISTTERLIHAKEKMLEAYGVSLFDRKQNGKYSGWEMVKLHEVLDEHGHKSTGKEEVYSVSVHKGLINQIEHLGRSFSAAKTDHYNRAHHGDIVYTKSPTGDFPLGVVKQSYTHEDVIVSPLYGVFTPKTYNLGVVIDFYFSSPQRAKNYLFPIIQKGAKNTIAITNKTFLSKKLHLPTDESEQRAVAEYVETARKEIDLLKKLAEKQKLQKRGLMQKLLTGIWRVNVEDAA